MVTLEQIKANSKQIGAAVLAVLFFTFGWQSHKWFTKPVTVTVQVPVQVQNPERPETVVGNTVTPAHHAVTSVETPVAPSDPLGNVHSTTVIEVPVIVPQLVKVFHQNSLSFSEQKNGYNVWVDGRVWATGENGETLPGLHAQTLFNKDAELFIPKTIKMPKERPWAVGGVYGVDTEGGATYGLFVDRDLAFGRLGIEILRNKTSQGIQHTQALLKAGARF